MKIKMVCSLIAIVDSLVKKSVKERKRVRNGLINFWRGLKG